MIYRVGTEEDWPAITQFLQDTDYFLPVDLTQIGGTWFVAEHGNVVKAVLWYFGWPPNVYIDYFAATNPMAAARLLGQTEAVLKAHGVRFIRANIPMNNVPMARLANGLGVNLALDYMTAFKEI